MERSDIINGIKRIIFPARWPLIGHWFSYWIRFPRESLCASLFLFIFSMMYGIGTATIMEGYFNKPFMIGMSLLVLLALTLLFLGLGVQYARHRELVRQRQERLNKAKPSGG